MEADGKLKLIIVGLFLAAFVIGYFIISQRMQRVQTFPVTGIVQQATPSPAPQPAETPVPAQLNQQKNGNGNVKGVASLPKTGFPLPLAGIFATSAVVSGWFLRRFPN